MDTLPEVLREFVQSCGVETLAMQQHVGSLYGFYCFEPGKRYATMCAQILDNLVFLTDYTEGRQTQINLADPNSFLVIRSWLQERLNAPSMKGGFDLVLVLASHFRERGYTVECMSSDRPRPRSADLVVSKEQEDKRVLIWCADALVNAMVDFTWPGMVRVHGRQRISVEWAKPDSIDKLEQFLGLHL